MKDPIKDVRQRMTNAYEREVIMMLLEDGEELISDDLVDEPTYKTITTWLEKAGHDLDEIDKTIIIFFAFASETAKHAEMFAYSLDKNFDAFKQYDFPALLDVIPISGIPSENHLNEMWETLKDEIRNSKAKIDL